jgi:hypothetical protein
MTFLQAYNSKLMEYGLAVVYLLLFVGFWRYVQGGTEPMPIRMARKFYSDFFHLLTTRHTEVRS